MSNEEKQTDDFSKQAEFATSDIDGSIITEFYRGRSIFITGGTGFMGKVLVEKLLRSCAGIKNIYLLIRPKRGQEVSARLTELIRSPLFDTIKRENPSALEKVHPICGDITSEQLGISKSDQDLLFRTVSIVFHSAATIKFDEKLNKAVTVNMLGTKRLVELCRQMMSLGAIIHVSTAFSNCDRKEIREIIYPSPYNPDDIFSLINWLPEDMLDELTPSLIGKRPNTYTFTKALTEQMLLKEVGNLPLAIIRPSIVLATFREPSPGWVDSWNGPNGVVTAMGQGILGPVICENDYVTDMVPVDIVTNLMIVTAWVTNVTATTKSPEIKVYNCVTSKQNQLTWREFVCTSIMHMIQHPFEDILWYPSSTLSMNRPLVMLRGTIGGYMQAYLVDFFALATGNKPIMVNTQKKLYKLYETLEFFTTNQWSFSDDNVRSLLKLMNKKDREIFQIDVSEIHWKTFIENSVHGIRKYLLKQSDESLPTCRKRIAWLYYLRQMLKILLVVGTSGVMAYYVKHRL